MDVYVLARIYFDLDDFVRCEHLLHKSFVLPLDSAWIKVLAAECLLKMEKYDDVVSTLGGESDLVMDPNNSMRIARY